MTTLKGKNMKTTVQHQVGSKHLITDSQHKTFKKKKKRHVHTDKNRKSM